MSKGCVVEGEVAVTFSELVRQDDVVAASTFLAANTSALLATDSAGYTAIHWAAHNDSVRMGKLLQSYGADINALGDIGMTPLELCGTRGCVEFAEWLVANAADASPRTSSPSALLYALLGERPECEIIAALLRQYVDDVDVNAAIVLFDARRVREVLPRAQRDELKDVLGYFRRGIYISGGRGYGNMSREAMSFTSSAAINAAATIREIIPYLTVGPRELGSVLQDLALISADGEGAVEFTLAVARELLDAGANPDYGIGFSTVRSAESAEEVGNVALAELIRSFQTTSS